MARLTIKKYKNNNSKNNGYGKTYGRLVYQDTMNTSDLCRHMMKHGTIFTSDVVKGVVEKFINCFEELLLEGNKIKLDGLPELADCSPLASDILRTFILAEYMSNICGTFMMAEDLLNNDNTISRDDYWQQFFSFVAPREKYLTDNPLLLIAGDWSFFNRMQFQVFCPTGYRVLNNNIQGEHIHITRSEWAYLKQKFHFTAIPFVVFVDKQGRVREDVTVEQLLKE